MTGGDCRCDEFAVLGSEAEFFAEFVEARRGGGARCALRCARCASRSFGCRRRPRGWCGGSGVLVFEGGVLGADGGVLEHSVAQVGGDDGAAGADADAGVGAAHVLAEELERFFEMGGEGVH